jgi:hypothetical protein
LFYFVLIAIFSCKKTPPVETVNTVVGSRFVNLDSIQKTNTDKIEATGTVVNKLLVSTSDSLVWIPEDNHLEHRIFGYEKPSTASRKLILISCFTSDVENNPFALPLGAYYTLDERHKLKYQKSELGFSKAKFIINGKEIADVYFEKKWIEFEE